jgi:hypothetical protein
MLNQKLYNRLKMSFWRSLMPCKSEASPWGSPQVIPLFPPDLQGAPPQRGIFIFMNPEIVILFRKTPLCSYRANISSFQR